MGGQGNHSSARARVPCGTICKTNCESSSNCVRVHAEDRAIIRGYTMSLRCAVYSRFSSDRQSPISINDQIRKCREYAGRQGWAVLEEHIYADHAVSGTSTERTELQRLLTAVEQKSRAF